VQTPKFLLERAARRALFGSWGNPNSTDPSVLGKDSGVANTSIVIHAGKVFACEEAHLPFELDPQTIASRGYWDFSGALKTGRFTAHPKIDPLTGEMVFFGYNIGGPFTNTIAYGFVDKTGKLTRMERFDAPYSSFAHDFLVTQNHLLFPILPLAGSLERARRGQSAYAWEPDKGSYVGIVRRDAPSSQIRWFRCDPCYVYHAMNAYEDGDKIIAHVCNIRCRHCFPNPARARWIPPKPRRSSTAGHSRLLTAPTNSSARRSTIFRANFPALNPYRYGYFAARADTAQGFDTLVTYDFKTGRRSTYGIPQGDAFSEPVFVPRGEHAGEGDGFLLATIYRATERRSDLAVFDAKTLADGPIALAELSHRVTLGFHGNWMDE